MTRLIACMCLLALMLNASPLPASAASDELFEDRFEVLPPKPPNILLVILDDVGIDQMSSFGYGGLTPPAMPSIDAIADGGLRFRNTWSMPECSPGRSVLLAGRFPLRNNIFQAIGPNDLANSQLSEFEVTAPKLLKHANYTSAMFGKFHLAGPDHNAAGNGTPALLGWDHFYGWTGGLPASIDTTAGGVAPEGTYSCGFVPDTAHDPVHGADQGACYIPDAVGNIGCLELSGNIASGDSPGLQCLTAGGILIPGQLCESPAPAYLAWDRENAHYVSPLVINTDELLDEVDLIDPRGRGYRSTIEVDAAIDWIQQRSDSDQPWMATVSFSSVHTPLQHPPAALTPSGVSDDLTSDCSNPVNRRRLSDAMTEAMDTELGRLLVETGLAAPDPGGGVIYDPEISNTVIVIYGDNGTFGPVVKAPFDPTRAKGSAYQTGIWVPLIVSGPMVESPGRDIEHMVNGVDVFQMFGELAGLDVPSLVPRQLDSVSMMAYLSNPEQYGLRQFNFAQGGLNIQVDGGVNGPCVFAAQCSHTPVSKSVCEDNGGVWWGEGADDPGVIQGNLEHCWQVNQAIYHDDPVNYPNNRVPMGWTVYQAIRNEHFKLIRNRALDFDPDTDDSELLAVEEFYHINQASPIPLLDTADRDLLADGDLDPIPAANYVQLNQALDAILGSQVPCPGDGNDDGRVDQLDIDNYHAIVAEWSGSSTYDFNFDAVTDAIDLQTIQANLGTVCWTAEP
jgi:arylsulfatase A-like enzyme